MACVRAKTNKYDYLSTNIVIDVIEDLHKVKIEKGNKAESLRKSLIKL